PAWVYWRGVHLQRLSVGCAGPRDARSRHRGIVFSRQETMNAVALYLVLLKATITSFAGLASLAVVRDELVVKRPVLTDSQLNEAVFITRATPGPAGLYVVSVGYFAGGSTSDFFQFAATNTRHKVIPFSVGEFHGVLIFTNGDALICNLYGGASGTGRTECNFDWFHKLHLL